MSDGAAVLSERDRLLAEYERRTGTRPRWLDEVKDEGIRWNLDQLDAPAEATLDGDAGGRVGSPPT